MGKSKPQPRNPLASALHYAVHREVGLRIFLDDSEVSIDTHHLERNRRTGAGEAGHGRPKGGVSDLREGCPAYRAAWRKHALEER